MLRGNVDLSPVHSHGSLRGARRHHAAPVRSAAMGAGGGLRPCFICHPRTKILLSHVPILMAWLVHKHLDCPLDQQESPNSLAQVAMGTRTAFNYLRAGQAGSCVLANASCCGCSTTGEGEALCSVGWLSDSLFKLFSWLRPSAGSFWLRTILQRGLESERGLVLPGTLVNVSK